MSAPLENENKILRRLLWMVHGHKAYLYGDDGEQQCHKCSLDFKRDSIRVIQERILKKIQPCWICNQTDPETDIMITVEAKTPGGERCKPMNVPVHHGCYMDMQP